MTSILIIDDDERLATPLKEYFARFNLSLHSEVHPVAGMSRLESGDYDLVILDVMLPDMSGFEVCRKIRSDSEIPIVMLTARGEVNDRVEGLEMGADDYLAKPFEPRELVARVQNILRRSEKRSPPADKHNFEDLEVDFARQSVEVMGQVVELTSNEFALLKLFVTHAGEKLTRDDISSRLRGVNVELFSRAVDVQVSRLRNKLKPTEYIKTVWGSGYQFVAPVANE